MAKPKTYPLLGFAAFLIVGGFVSDMAFLVVLGVALLIFCAGVAVGSWATDVES